MRLYNTLGRQLQNFKPVHKESVSLYTCGPTVYDHAHIGNLRSFVFDDTLRRALQVNGYVVKHVMNITDVGHLASDADEGEDKLQKGAERENKSVWDIADHYIKVFKDDMAQLNVLEPNAYKGASGTYARATDFIQQQIDIVKILLEKNYAYITKQAIYFDVGKLSDYGKLTGQNLADKEVGVREEVVTDINKHHPQDFALWFFKVGRFANHDMSWDSPWGEGFPGWHLECSAIVHATLGEPLDIHTGGVDHIGTHHTNEIAQTEAAFGLPLAHYWLHNEHLLVDGQKMSKSLGNFLTLKDVTNKGYDPLALRLLFLQAHYRSQLNFTWESLESAQSFLMRLQAWADLKYQPLAKKSNDDDTHLEIINKMKAALADDLNSAEALALLSRLATVCEEEGTNVAKQQELLEEIDGMLGLSLSKRVDIKDEAKDLLERRQKARDNQQWGTSDKLRQQLRDLNIEVNDTVNGQIWRRSR